MAPVVHDHGGVVTLPLHGHVVPLAVVDSVPVQADDARAAAEVEAELEGAFDDLRSRIRNGQ